MAELASVEEYLTSKDSNAVELFRRFEKLVERRGPSWKRERVFVGAYVDGRRLELNIDLLREAEHPCLLAAFRSTKRVVTHRLRITNEQELDDSLAALVEEAHAEVCPGTRGLH